MSVELSIKRNIAPLNKWHWAIILPGGHIFETSKKSFDSIELCVADAGLEGVQSLHAAEQVCLKTHPI
jgi:hypothetical protein